MAKDYDVTGAFQSIENQLISSMLINFKRHRAWEREEGFDWSMWQAEQLKSMKSYRLNNQKHFGGYFPTINEKIEEMLIKSYAAGNMEQEVEILKAIRRGFKSPEITPGKSTLIQGEFFKVNDRKLDALIKATKDDMIKAEHAMLRKANDEYRKTIFNAQVYANTGSGTMEKSVDMATKDFLSKGINCIQYKNGASVNIVDYVAMAIQTANKRAYLQGEGAKRQEWGMSTVIVAKRGAGCPKCVKHQGRIYIDDVWSGGTSKDGNYQLISSAMAAGLYHPRCKDTHTTYFEGITSEPTRPTRAEQQKAVETYNLQQKQRYNERQIKKYKNLESGSLDKDNQDKYKARRMQWQQVQRELVDNNSDIISRDYSREKIKGYSNNLESADESDIWNKVKTLFTGGDTKIIVNEFERGLDKIENTKVKNVLEGSKRRVEFKKWNNKRSRYDKDTKTVLLGDNADSSTIAHELFHEIDRKYNISNNDMITKQIQLDYERIQNIATGYGKTIEDMLYFKYPNAFIETRRGKKFKKEYRGVSDIINGMSEGEIKLGYGHLNSYWKKPDNLKRETWAQFGRILYNNDKDVIEMCEFLFKSTSNEVSTILGKVVI